MLLNLKAPHQVYRLGSGEKVPGVTTVLGIYAKEALLGWYAGEEREGILRDMGTGVWSADRLRVTLPIDEKGKPRWYAVTQRDKAADLGTIAHAHIQARLAGELLEAGDLDSLMYADAMVPAGRFFGWMDEHKMMLVRSEQQMVSEKWQVGGTGDCFVRGNDGLLEYWDVKTSKPWKDKHPYDEQIAQSAAYADMWQETEGEPVARIRIARVGKTTDDPGDLYPVTDAMRACGMTLFQNAVSAYNAKKMLGRMFR